MLVPADPQARVQTLVSAKLVELLVLPVKSLPPSQDTAHWGRQRQLTESCVHQVKAKVWGCFPLSWGLSHCNSPTLFSAVPHHNTLWMGSTAPELPVPNGRQECIRDPPPLKHQAVVACITVSLGHCQKARPVCQYGALSPSDPFNILN